MTRLRSLALIVAVVVLAAACGSDSPAETTQTADTQPAPSTPAADQSTDTSPAAEIEFTAIQIPNRGDSSEGHTPRQFAGTGTGLFTGDNLNPGFPNGVGLQILLTFDLPSGIGSPTTATLVSDALTERGNAFEALGPLQAEPISYEQFGPPLFELEADGPAVICARASETRIECDVSEAAQDAIAGGADKVQLRVQFETQSDSDGEQDLAMFFLTDSNTNEPGIFFLELT